MAPRPTGFATGTNDFQIYLQKLAGILAASGFIEHAEIEKTLKVKKANFTAVDDAIQSINDRLTSQEVGKLANNIDGNAMKVFAEYALGIPGVKIKNTKIDTSGDVIWFNVKMSVQWRNKSPDKNREVS